MRPPDPAFRLRVALPRDEPALGALIPRSARALSAGFYTSEQAEAAITHVFGVDSSLVRDGTYFVVESHEPDGIALAGCGGWSRRRTLYGGDQHARAKKQDDDLLRPGHDAARIRAFFVAPEYARRGVGALLLEACAQAARDAGFDRLELMATLPGVPLYAAWGFAAIEPVSELLPGGVSVPFIRMAREL